MSNKQIVLAFDLYGTLLSTESIAKQLAVHFGQEQAQSISTAWRRYQLEYTWRLNSMGRYNDFSNVTRNSLLHALAENGVQLDEKAIEELMTAYDSLSTFPDVIPALTKLAAKSNITPVVFSNGTKSMVSNSVFRSKDLSPKADFFRDIITVDEVKKYKPAPATYIHLAEKLGKDTSQMGDMWLISGNPFDIVGSRSSGMKAIWVDRAGRGWIDGAVPELPPTAIIRSLEEIAGVLDKHAN
ncbi:haloacid dehalogenase, type II [Paecilomyces variotii No. 5]|uniref:Haloacid dehalogenase, type II n=1 Tax=Byssochlamys spectabilis (strain No. 5 / NBRC 109023) TaxID=1356009 RepID=V5FN00_BYSSN|nr:haloacid dehalogenase, type II [Paecilomyces variotii No. 5]